MRDGSIGSVMIPSGTFPVRGHKGDKFPLERVPWAFLAPHEDQAKRNHGQTLERLAERGGLSAKEMLAVVTGCHWLQMYAIDSPQANRQLLQHLQAWKEKRNA